MFEILITIILLGYDGTANLTVAGVGTFEVTNGTEIFLEKGTYTFELHALNKVFVKEAKGTDEYLVFNLKFTNSTEKISIFYHTILSSTVTEVIVLTNNGEDNFEGNLTVPLPNFRNLAVKSSNLDFLSYILEKESITFNYLLIPANGSGQIVVSYELNSNVFYRNGRSASFMVLTDLDLENFEGLTFQEERTLHGTSFKIFYGEDSEYYVKFKSKMLVEYNLLALLAILLSSAIIFIHFYEKKGKWKL